MGVEPRDLAEVIVDVWSAGRPAPEVTTKLLALRLRRVAHHLERALRRELAAHETEVWELEMLLGLRRAPGCRASAGTLLREAQVTSGAITNRLDRLEQRGWVRRDVDPADRRQVLVTLTGAGRQHTDELVAIKTVTEQRIFAALGKHEQGRIAADLKRLLLELEGPVGSDAPEQQRCRPPLVHEHGAGLSPATLADGRS